MKSKKKKSVCGLKDHRHRHHRVHHGNKSLSEDLKEVLKSQESLYNEYESLSSSSDSSDRIADISEKIEKHRSKRSTSHIRNVETMVVVDTKMYQYHGQNLEHYVLTLMALVNSIYRHPSIGNFINIVVVKLVVLKDETDGPEIISNAASTLRNFCLWQQSQNKGDDSDPTHADTAVLLTRQDICRSSTKCDTLGLAELGTMCDPYRSCSIIEDNGLSAAFTIAHEVGHVFNLPHDDSKKCDHRKGKYHVMAPTLNYNTNPWSWSTCSSKELTEFLDLGYGECLLDSPTTSLTLPSSLPGADKEYPVNKQCELIFGANSTVCPYMRTCKRLWCTGIDEKGCRTQHMPWADGTSCGPNKWCDKGECVENLGARSPINGGWSPWEKYSECSRTCNGGIKYATRKCTNPVPQNGGKYCLGRRTKYRSCRTKSCPGGERDFREQQCSKYDGQHFNMNGLPPSVRWVPKYSGITMKDRCKLLCRVSGSALYYQLSKTVIDGTACSPDTDDICVQGLCRKAGCDHVLNSGTKKDLCGVCGGDNSACRRITNSYSDSKYGYNTVVRIPAGAKNIDIRQHGYNNRVEDGNYLAVMNSRHEYILNGNYAVSMYRREIHVANTRIEYSGSDTVIERINCSSTIHQDLILQVLSVGNLYPPNINYTYTVPIQGTVVYVWDKYGPWEQCSALCNGSKQRIIRCLRASDRLEVAAGYCNEMTKPMAVTSRCNTKCSFRWSITESECSARCGTGQRTRKFTCIKVHQRNSVIVDSRHCSRLRKPGEVVECQGTCPPSHWEYGSWTECTHTCNGGIQTRDSVCIDDDGNTLHDHDCDESNRLTQQPCNTQTCPEWTFTDWSACSATCGVGQKHRQIFCRYGNEHVNYAVCDSTRIPGSYEECQERACPVWEHSVWGPCTVSCGTGYQIRAILCRYPDGLGHVDEESCDADQRPIGKQDCGMAECPKMVTTTTTTTTTVAPTAAAVFKMAPIISNWRTGDWTPCSRSCDVGTRERYVSCRDPFGGIADESECDATVKPAQKENCEVQPCPFWRTGQWIECPVSCGTGRTSRYVACVYHDNRIGNDEDCTEEDKPVQQQLCNTHECARNNFPIVITDNDVTQTSYWRIGPWSPCTTSCGIGNRRRAVVCQDKNGESGTCDEDAKPEDQEVCDEGPCPTWNYGEWGVCSKSCDSGNKSRVVQCQMRNGQSLEDDRCDLTKRPLNTVPCNMGGCPPEPQWHRGQWSPCSKSCDKGQRYREVYCKDGHGRVIPDEICPDEKPKHLRGCRLMKCPKWKSEPWSECSVTCGEGQKTRELKCLKKNNRLVSVELCDPRKKPPIIRKCKREECITYTWRTGRWSQCTRSCGGGQRHRVVHCIDSEGRLTEEDHCNRRKPRESKKCNSESCPVPSVKWTLGEWDQCSTTCGQGEQTRVVTCQSLSKEGWPIPGEVTGCDIDTKPQVIRPCNFGECEWESYWRTGAWSECSKTCGIGIRQRRVQCQGRRDGRSRPATECAEPAIKPEAVRTCFQGPCLPRSCREIQEMRGKREDGEYHVLVHGRTLQIYCHAMHTTNPSEYLSLPAGEAENFSEIYAKSLLQPATCPYDGHRNDDCACTDNSHPQAGLSAFSKLRIDINTLTVIIEDGRYSSNSHGRFVPYASAGDCYSHAHCPQGRFYINLTGTGLAVSPDTSWDTQGRDITRNIFREKNGIIIIGSCGGYCGNCFPDSETGLKLIFLSQ
ncbi:A disintegrin and metalloproteinase with thrombospondin motifs 9-like [Glandiceps talaboti]